MSVIALFTTARLLIAPPAVISADQIGWAVEQIRAAVLESNA